MKSQHHWKHIFVGAAMIVIASFLLIWCLRQIDFGLFWRDLSRASFLYLIAAMGCIYGILIINVWQWQLFLPQGQSFSFQRMFRVIRVKQMMANVLPWGNAVALYHMGQVEKVGKTVALSVMTLEHIAGGFSKLTIFLLVAVIVPLPVWMKNGVTIAAISVTFVYLALLFVAHRHHEFKDVDQEGIPVKQNSIRYLVARWAYHLHVIRDFKKTVLVILLAILMKLCEVAAVHLVQLSFELDLPLWSSFFLVAALNLAMIVPIVPGNLGVFEATAFFAYKFMGVNSTQAMSLALFYHIVYLIPMVVPGYWVSMRIGIRLSRVIFSSDSNSVYLR